MATNDYHFITHWRVQGTAQEVSNILEDPLDLPRWWPSVYLESKLVQGGEGIDKVIDLYTKGWLPYTLRWRFRILETVPLKSIHLEAWGDFVGEGLWTFEQDEDWVNITYDWKIRAEKPLLRELSFLFKPIFSANHRWAMARGEESLKLELARLHASVPEERAKIPPPPGPTFSQLVRR